MNSHDAYVNRLPSISNSRHLSKAVELLALLIREWPQVEAACFAWEQTHARARQAEGRVVLGTKRARDCGAKDGGAIREHRGWRGWCMKVVIAGLALIVLGFLVQMVLWIMFRNPEHLLTHLELFSVAWIGAVVASFVGSMVVMVWVLRQKYPEKRWPMRLAGGAFLAVAVLILFMFISRSWGVTAIGALLLIPAAILLLCDFARKPATNFRQGSRPRQTPER